MNRCNILIPIGLFVISMISSCSNEEDQISGLEPGKTITPTLLIFPLNNTECNEGKIVSETETEVLFQWEATENTSSYILGVKNLNTGISRDLSTISNEFLIRVERGTPYSWTVKSKGQGSNEVAESDVWKFYNAGLPVESHPPFPAEAVSPKIGTSIEAGAVLLEWEATDVDDDISFYTILLDTANPPIDASASSSANSLNVTVDSGNVYYWKVVTTDEFGNTSDSPIFQFAAN